MATLLPGIVAGMHFVAELVGPANGAIATGFVLGFVALEAVHRPALTRRCNRRSKKLFCHGTGQT